MPRYPAGRVYRGCCSRPEVNESSDTLSGEPITPGRQPGHRVYQHHRRRLPPVSTKSPTLICRVRQALGYPLVHPAVVAANQDQRGRLGKLLGDRLIE